MQDLLNDIASQPAALIAHLELLRTAYAAGAGWSDAGRPVVMTGMATSLYVWHSAGLLLTQTHKRPQIIETSEYLALKEDWAPGQVVAVMSRSRESVEIARLANEVVTEQILVGITKYLESTLARRSTQLLGYSASEQSFCNSKSFMLSMTLALAIAGGMSHRLPLDPVGSVAPRQR